MKGEIQVTVLPYFPFCVTHPPLVFVSFPSFFISTEHEPCLKLGAPAIEMASGTNEIGGVGRVATNAMIKNIFLVCACCCAVHVRVHINLRPLLLFLCFPCIRARVVSVLKKKGLAFPLSIP